MTRVARTIATGVTLTFLAVIAPAVSHAATPSPRCTITGTAASERLVGTPGNDVICGLAGNDTIVGNGGNDTIVGGRGKDTIDGGMGADVILGGEDNDRLIGGPGNDRISGGAGTDTLIAGVGVDTCAPDRSDGVTGACQVDATPPTISSVAVTNPATAGQTLTITWRVSDSSGLSPMAQDTPSWAKIGGPSGWITWCGFPVAATLASGNANDGVYRADCYVPANAVNGEYTVWVGAYDVFGNAAESPAYPFTVGGGSSDSAAPSVTNVVATPGRVSPGDSITFTWQATDTTGVSYVIPWAFGPNGRLVDDSGKLWMSYAAGALVSGDSRQGTYTVTLQMSPSAAAGTYVLYLSAADVLGNKSYSDTGANGAAYGTFTVG